MTDSFIKLTIWVIAAPDLDETLSPPKPNGQLTASYTGK